MADQKVSDLPSLNGADVDAADLLYIIDSSAGSAGSKKITVGQYQLAPVSGGTANGVVYLNASKVATAGSDLVFDGSNLGLGVTPSAWQSVYKAIDVGNSLSLMGGSNAGDLYYNAFINSSGNFIYRATTTASAYSLAGGQHRWFTAPSGTAGNAITFTQAMTLDASSRLFVGTTSGSAALNIYGDSTNWFTVSSSSTSGSFGTFVKGGTTTAAGYIGTDGGGIVGGGTGDNFGIRAESDLLLMAGAAERARITSVGDLLVGTTSNTLGARINVAASNVGLNVDAVTVSGAFKSTTSGTETGQYWNAATTGNNILVAFYTETVPAGRGTISYNRGAGLVAYNTTSDYRAKDIIGPVQNPGATIDALKVYEGVMKGATQSRPMLVAHEAQAVAPYCVTGEKDAVNEDGAPVFQQMDVSALVPLLLAEIQSLRARVAALESA